VIVSIKRILDLLVLSREEVLYLSLTSSALVDADVPSLTCVGTNSVPDIPSLLFLGYIDCTLSVLRIILSLLTPKNYLRSNGASI
jgi:hypothetical protein